MSFVSKFTMEIMKKVQSLSAFAQIKPIYFMGNIQEFNNRVGDFRGGLLRNVTISCLQKIPNLNKYMIKKLMKRMPSIKFIYNKIEQLKNFSEKYHFLKWFLEDLNPKKGTIRLFVDLLFFDEYRN
jgi:hypothetical protein